MHPDKPNEAVKGVKMFAPLQRISTVVPIIIPLLRKLQKDQKLMRIELIEEQRNQQAHHEGFEEI